MDVYNVTGGGADLLESVCDITDTSYTFSASDPDQLFNFTVTPKSNVEGSLNGTTSQPVQGYLSQSECFATGYMYEFTFNSADPVQIPSDDIDVNIMYNSLREIEIRVFFPLQVSITFK